ncbi:hypothetical protein B0H17DRAFT_368995 [Mycena rosella]|uniref:C2H2-type domain-containing protein n=1 Tax=Mycena rosella TaxID=1033263 RepID=A0AAD7MB84_MYCRO|nr:hypothetical protein B0H17DRAFT_368995 [Mycena rosella]
MLEYTNNVVGKSSYLLCANLEIIPATPAAAATTTATTGPSILLPQKPFRCPKPNCSKSYKQANGLKYHMTRGSCNYSPAKDLEAVRALLERKRATAAAAASRSSSTLTPAPEEEEEAGAGGEPSPLSQAELNEVEMRARPFACGVGDCARRYKNMNGLRYHYQHSGDHGAVGLGLLAGGVHGCLREGANGAAGAGMVPAAQGSAYVWGSTLPPHIQAVAGAKATTPPAAAAAAPIAKTKVTPFTPRTTAAHAPATTTATTTPEYFAQIVRDSGRYEKSDFALNATRRHISSPIPGPPGFSFGTVNPSRNRYSSVELEDDDFMSDRWSRTETSHSSGSSTTSSSRDSSSVSTANSSFSDVGAPKFGWDRFSPRPSLNLKPMSFDVNRFAASKYEGAPGRTAAARSLDRFVPHLGSSETSVGVDAGFIPGSPPLFLNPSQDMNWPWSDVSESDSFS